MPASKTDTAKIRAARKVARNAVMGDTPAVETAAVETAAVETPVEAKADKPAREPRTVDLPLDPEQAAWVAAHARPAVSLCLCGCGQTTKGRFFPGHDAILKARLARTDSDDARKALATFGW